MHGEATIDANPFLVLFTIILLAYHWIRHKYGHIFDKSISHIQGLSIEHYVNDDPENDDRNDCTTLVQEELEKHFAGVIEPLDIKNVLEAHNELVQSGDRYSRKAVCKAAFNSVSSDAYGRTKAILDTLENI